MDKERKIDLKKYTSKPVSKFYLIRVIFYVVILGALIYLFFDIYGDKYIEEPEVVDTIDQVNISIEN